MRLRRRTECGRTSCAALDRHASTNSAVRDSTENIFNLAGAKCGVYGLNWGHAAQRTIGALQPAQGAIVFAERLRGKSHNSGETIEAVGFVARQPSAATAALQAPGRQVERGCQLFQSQARGSHQLFNDRRGK